MKRKVGRPRNWWKTSKIAIPQPILAEVNELVAKFKREQGDKSD